MTRLNCRVEKRVQEPIEMANYYAFDPVSYFYRICYYNRIVCDFDNPLLRQAERTLTTDSVSSCIIASLPVQHSHEANEL